MLKLEVKDAAKWFGVRKIFENISFNLEPGRSIAVVGPNGSGKTTLLRLIMGLTIPTMGKIEFTDGDRKLDFNARCRMLSLVAPYLSLYSSLTACENLSFISRVNGIITSNGEIDDILEKVGLEGRGHEPISNFSSGMLQRLKYAAALIKNPAILILDEPTSNLDDEGKNRVFNIIRQYRPDSIILIATNEKEEYSLADSFCQLGR